MGSLLLTAIGLAVGMVLAVVGLATTAPELVFVGPLVVWLTLSAAMRKTTGSPIWRRFRRHAIVRQKRAHFSIRGFIGLSGVALLSGADSVVMVACLVFLVANVLVADSIPRTYGRAFRSDILLGKNAGLDDYLNEWRWFDTTSRPFAKVVRYFRTAVVGGEPLLWALGFVAAVGDNDRILTIGAVGIAAVGVVAVFIDVVKIAVAVRNKVFVKKRRRTLEAIDALEPQIAVYFSANSKRLLYQIRQWIPTLLATERSIVIITREQPMLRWLDRLSPDITVIWVRKLSDLELIAPDSLEIVCYVNNAAKNAHMVRRTSLTHVQLLHGESDKQSSASRASTAFDRVAVAGQAAIDRYKNQGIDLPPEQYMVVGRPSTDILHRGPTYKDVPCILYAPTWEGHDDAANTSSISPQVVDVVRSILRDRPDVRFLFKPHPLTGSRDPSLIGILAEIRAEIEVADLRDPDVGHKYMGGPGAPSLFEAFDMSDLLLGDVSSVIADYLATERPMIVFETNSLGAEELKSTTPTSRGAAICPVAAAPTLAAIDDALGVDKHRAERLASRRYILGDFEGTATDKFCREFDAIFGERPPRPVAEGKDAGIDEDGAEAFGAESTQQSVLQGTRGSLV